MFDFVSYLETSIIIFQINVYAIIYQPQSINILLELQRIMIIPFFYIIHT